LIKEILTVNLLMSKLTAEYDTALKELTI